MTTVEPDTFVEDDYNADWKLLEDIVRLCDSETLYIRKTVPESCSKFEHYNNIICEAEEVAGMKVFMSTKRFRPNYVICSSDMFPIFNFSYDYKLRESDEPIHGTYLSGMYKDFPVLVSPVLKRGEMIWGVNDETAPGVITFTKDNKVCHKIVNINNFVMLKLED